MSYERMPERKEQLELYDAAYVKLRNLGASYDELMVLQGTLNVALNKSECAPIERSLSAMLDAVNHGIGTVGEEICKLKEALEERKI